MIVIASLMLNWNDYFELTLQLKFFEKISYKSTNRRFIEVKIENGILYPLHKK